MKPLIDMISSGIESFLRPTAWQVPQCPCSGLKTRLPRTLPPAGRGFQKIPISMLRSTISKLRYCINIKMNLLALGVISILLAGCTLRPQYTRPASPVPGNWPDGEAYKMNADASMPAAADLPWQAFFTDTRLQKIIDISLRNNRDLRLAMLNVERARALYGIQQAELYPSFNAVASESRGRVPADLSYTGTSYSSKRYDLNLGISSWEIDFFGRIGDLKDRALEEFFATEQARNSAQIILIEALANTYLSLAADRENLKLAAATLETQEAAHRLIRRRYEVGLASELDLQRIQSQVEAARGEIARNTQIAAQHENTLQLLAGSTIPQTLLPNGLEDLCPVRKIFAGIPSEVLLHRPDVLAAEHRLKGANANIAVARKAFFPRISLTTTLGTASAELSGLFKGGSGTWSFAPLIALPVFDARTWSAYEVTKVEKEIYIAQYEKAIQTAFREVADALVVQGTVNRQIKAHQSLVDALAETYRLSNVRYAKGTDNYLSVLDAQRSLYAAQQGLTALNLARLINQVTLYKVLGGGGR